MPAADFITLPTPESVPAEEEPSPFTAVETGSVPTLQSAVHPVESPVVLGTADDCVFPPAAKPSGDSEAVPALVFPPADRSGAAALPREPAHTEPQSTGTGMTICGAVLIILGLWSAVHAATQVLDAAEAVSRGQRQLHYALALPWAVGFAGFLSLGFGAIFLRRWAAPLIHALGWVVALPVLLGILALTVFMFSQEEAAASLDAGTWIGIAALCGVILPMGCIACCQRDSVAHHCAAADPCPRWTDPRPIPVLMVFCLGVLLTTACGSLAIGGVGFAWMGAWLTAPSSALAWTLTGSVCIAGTAMAACQMRGTVVLFMVLTVLLGVSFTLTLRAQPLPESLPAGLAFVFPWAVVGLLLPVLLLLLITRRSFASAA